MLSDEERKEYIEHEILDRLYCLEENDFDKNKVDDGYIKAVLNACKEAKNLIEKQSKEIEELKKEYERVRAGRNWLSEHISAQIATPELFDRLVEENYISKDKIKAKIEIRKEEKENCKDSIEEKYLLREIYVLQSLLEKE